MWNKFLLKQQKDVLSERIEKSGEIKKYEFFFAASILCSLLTIGVGSVSILRFMNAPPPETVAVNLKENTAQTLITLPYPHQSLKNVTKWLEDAVMDAYSFDFNNFDKVVDRMDYYFTPEGFAAYKKAMYSTSLKQQIVAQKIKVSTVVNNTPILLGGGFFAGTEYWRFNVPIRVSYYGGENAKVQDMIVDILVVKIPTHENSKGLGIAEFSMRVM